MTPGKDREEVVCAVRGAFGGNEYPGDSYLQGSTEGCEPFDEVEPFRGKTSWEAVEPGFLDQHGGALHFFSEAGLRFFLPAYLIADLRGELTYADPLLSLTLGFLDVEVKTTAGDREFVLRTGKSELLNPRRYGAATFYDHARYRFSIFTREEAQAIVAYLEYKRDTNPGSPDRPGIDAALDGFWRDRAQNAPPAESLKRHLEEKAAFLAAVTKNSP